MTDVRHDAPVPEREAQFEIAIRLAAHPGHGRPTLLIQVDGLPATLPLAPLLHALGEALRKTLHAAPAARPQLDPGVAPPWVH